MLAEARLDSKVLAIIGNHDVCGLSARLGWPKRLSKTDLERACNGLMLAGQPFEYPWAKVVEPRVVIFGLDTNNSGNLSPLDNAVGRIGSHQLQRFSELLAKHRDVPVKIVAIHHSPNIPEIATAIRRGQAPMPLIYRWTHQIPPEERRAFRHLCLAAKVRLVVHGHLHQAEDRRVNGLRIIGAPAATEPIDLNAKPRQYRFYQYTVRGAGGRVDVELLTV
jgi:calcineurin-like phosphoesterase family protein